MIITEIKTIDCLVEQFAGNDSNFVSIDINDYNHIKVQSSSLKAIELELLELSDTTIKSINDAISEAGYDGISNVLFHVSGNGSSAGVRVPSLQQMQMLLNTLQEHIDTANMIWGMGEGAVDDNAIKILIVLGYS